MNRYRIARTRDQSNLTRREGRSDAGTGVHTARSLHALVTALDAATSEGATTADFSNVGLHATLLMGEATVLNAFWKGLSTKPDE